MNETIVKGIKVFYIYKTFVTIFFQVKNIYYKIFVSNNFFVPLTIVLLKQILIMISADFFNKAIKTLDRAKEIVKTEMPNAEFFFLGIDEVEKQVHFNMVAKSYNFTPQQVKDLKEKTPFLLLDEFTKPFYKGHFSIGIS